MEDFDDTMDGFYTQAEVVFVLPDTYDKYDYQDITIHVTENGEPENLGKLILQFLEEENKSPIPNFEDAPSLAARFIGFLYKEGGSLIRPQSVRIAVGYVDCSNTYVIRGGGLDADMLPHTMVEVTYHEDDARNDDVRYDKPVELKAYLGL